MKKKTMVRIIGIGLFHSVLYLYVVPYVIYPKFGNNGYKFAAAVAILIFIAVFGTIFIEREKKGEKK